MLDSVPSPTVVSSVNFKLRLSGVFHLQQLRGAGGKEHRGVEFGQALGQKNWAGTELQDRDKCSGTQAGVSVPKLALGAISEL